MELTFEDDESKRHYERLFSACFNKYDLNDVVRYIEEKTYLNGSRYSFKDHEFQKDIISDTHPNVNVQKCAQVGLSEIMARYALAITRVMPYFDTILTMPGANDAGNFFKTRIDPIINDSPDLKASLMTAVDNTEIKALGTGLLYGRGTRGTTAALSVPADMLIHDEVDRSDPHTLAQYQSRLKHSKWKLTRKFGTPTIPGTGIALAMSVSKRFRHMVKCNHCNHWFSPSYHENVVIPGFERAKKEISAHNLLSLQWEKAYVACPKCGDEPSLQHEHREWVCENPNDNLDAHGYFVTPFSVPNIVPVSRIVKESTLFTWAEFVNQTLGETSSETADTLTEEDIVACKYLSPLASGEIHHMGVDLGALCHITVGRMTQDGTLLVVRRVVCGLMQLRETCQKLRAEYHVLIEVWDQYPYTEMILDLQKTMRNLYASQYVVAKLPRIFEVVSKEENMKEGKLPVTGVLVSRDLHFDEIMKLFKEKRILWAASNDVDDMLFTKQLLDMKRVMVFDKFNDGRYTWQKKANDEDHFHHSLGYLLTACKLAPTATTHLPISVPIARRIKVASAKETLVYGSMR